MTFLEIYCLKRHRRKTARNERETDKMIQSHEIRIKVIDYYSIEHEHNALDDAFCNAMTYFLSSFYKLLRGVSLRILRWIFNFNVDKNVGTDGKFMLLKDETNKYECISQF